MISRSLWLTILIFIGLSSSEADAQHQRDLATNSGTSRRISPGTTLQDGEIPVMEGDEEFGEQIIIERVSNWYPWYLDLSANGFRTTNARLSDGGEQTDSYFREAAYLGFTPNLTGNLFFDFGISQETYRYKILGDLDFDYLRTHAGVFQYLPTGEGIYSALFGNGFLFANYAYYRVTDSFFGSEAFSNHSAVLGFQKAIPIKRGHQIYYGVASDLSLRSSDNMFQRHEHRIYTGYSVEWTEDLLTQIGYVASLFDYLHTPQMDWVHTVEANANLVIARPQIFGQESQLYIEASVIFNLNDSNQMGLDYEYVNWGGGIGIRSSF